MAKKIVKDERFGNQGWSTNPLTACSNGALAQAMAPVMDWVKLQKNIINKFNDKGRPENVTEWVDIQCVVIPDGERSRRQTANGDRSEMRFSIMYLAPVQLYIGNIIWHPDWGFIKIEGYDGMKKAGLTSAKGIALNGTVDVEDGEVIRSLPKQFL